MTQQTKSKDKEQIESFFEVLTNALSRTKEAAEKEKSLPNKLTAKESSAIKRIDTDSALSDSQFLLLAQQVSTLDPNLRLMQQVASVATNHSNEKIRSSLIEDCAKLVSVWWMGVDLAQKRSIFLSVWEKLSSTSLQSFIELLEGQYEARCRKSSDDAAQDADDSKLTASVDHVELLANIKFVALHWLLIKGLVEATEVVDFLIGQHCQELDVLPKDLQKLSLFVIENVQHERDPKLLKLLKYMLNQQTELQRAKNVEISKRSYVEKELLSEKQKNAQHDQQNAELQKKVLTLQASIDELNKQLEQQQALGKAERVHLKDDHGKIKHKTLNTLEEQVMPLLEMTSHALNKDVPKVHVATHKLEQITEEIEGIIKWLKK